MLGTRLRIDSFEITYFMKFLVFSWGISLDFYPFFSGEFRIQIFDLNCCFLFSFVMDSLFCIYYLVVIYI